MINRLSRRALACALFTTTALTTTGLATPALAQLAPPAPVRQMVDGNGVNLFDGKLFLTAPALSMGQGGQKGLAFYKLNQGSGWTDNLSGGLALGGSTMTVSLGATSDRFTVSGATYTNTEGNGSTLSYNGTSKIYTYTRSDGTVVRFDKNKAMSWMGEGLITDITTPSGEKLVYNYQGTLYCKSYKPGGGGYICTQTGNLYRLTSVRNSYGYQIGYSYNYDYMYDPTVPEVQPDFAAYSNVVGVTATNLAVASGGTVRTQSFGEVTEGGSLYYGVTDAMGRQTKFRYGTGGVAGVKLPGSTSEDMTIAYSGGRVIGITTPAGTTSYAASDALGVRTITVTDPLNHATTYKFNIASERLTEVIDANNRTTAMQYDSSGRLTRTTAPELNYIQLTYDARGNVTERRAVPKTGTGPNDIITLAKFPDTCANPKTCNQPEWTRDAKGNQTDYTYDAAHGGVLKVTAPAPTAGADRPETRYSYSSLQAYFKNGSGSIVASGEPVTLLTGTSACHTGVAPACVDTANEVKSSISYGPQTAGTGNNLLPVLVSQGSGDNLLVATTAYTYDDVGNLTYVDGPLAGTADTSRTLYNANRETIGTISPDPDGTGGTLPNRATRITIDARGLVTKQEQGTTAGQSDAAWAGFLAYTASDIFYDSSRRPFAQSLSGGGVTHAMTQTSYDAAGRVDCVAIRMNPAIYGSLPASACTLGTQGSHGPDRITKNIYDNANQLLEKRVAVGVVGEEATEATLTYSNNGKLATLKDALNNLTTYEYDGFDRLSKTRYPVTAQGSNASSTTDYEQLLYDANSNVTERRLRGYASDNTQKILFAYDNLNRVTGKDLPGSEPDVSYGYDLLGRLTSASQPGHALGFSYDALSRQLAETGPLGIVSNQWDLAGRRTRLSTSAGHIIDYQRLVTGEIKTMLTGDGTMLANFTYDALGRRTGLSRVYGTSSTWSYDAVSRLSGLSHSFTNTANNVSWSFTYNPPGQIATSTRSNDAYAWTGHGSGSTASVADGLNRLTSIGGVSTAHDARGNVTTDPTSGKSYGYSSENLLTSSTGGTSANLVYDPLGRLYQLSSGGTVRRFLYAIGESGLPENISEYNGSNALTQIHVFGPGVDEPMMWWDWTAGGPLRHLHADERGSIVAVSDSGGSAIALNKYDEYGKPQAGNLGRFQYTGQMWLPEIGAYYYKARVYSPTFGGRFLQTDPIGVEGGINLYAYVGNDPVNFADPLGLTATIVVKCDAECQFRNWLKERALENFIEAKEGVRLADPADLQDPMESADGPEVTVMGSVNCGRHPDDPRCRGRVAQNQVIVRLPPPGQPKEVATDIACGILPDDSLGCAEVDHEILCQGAKERFDALAPLSIIGRFWTAYRNRNTLPAGAGGQRALGVLQGLIEAETAADWIDMQVYCKSK